MESFDIEELVLVCPEIWEESRSALLSNDCLSEDVKELIRNVDGPALLQDLQFLNQCLVKKGRFRTAAKEKAYSNYHREFIIHCKDIERHIPSPASTWVCLKVFEMMVNKNYNLPNSPSAANDKNHTPTQLTLYFD